MNPDPIVTFIGYRRHQSFDFILPSQFAYHIVPGADTAAISQISLHSGRTEATCSPNATCHTGCDQIVSYVDWKGFLAVSFDWKS